MISNVSAVASYLEKAVRDFTDLAVVGISGGVDSSVVACVCVRALGKENVHLVSMPYDEIDLSTFNARSAELAEQLGTPHYVTPISESTLGVQHVLEKSLPGKLEVLTYANIRPRVRMNILYSFSGELGLRTGRRARVMGTGHLSEDLIGYDTKGGDALADIFILSDLVKSEVYQLAEHYQVPKSIREAVPSAGLYPDQTDEDELGYNYDQLERPTLAVYAALKRGVRREDLKLDLPEFKGLEAETLRFVITRYQAHFHKHLAPVSVDCRRSEWFK